MSSDFCEVFVVEILNQINTLFLNLWQPLLLQRICYMGTREEPEAVYNAIGYSDGNFDYQRRIWCFGIANGARIIGITHNLKKCRNINSVDYCVIEDEEDVG